MSIHVMEAYITGQDGLAALHLLNSKQKFYMAGIVEKPGSSIVADVTEGDVRRFWKGDASAILRHLVFDPKVRDAFRLETTARLLHWQPNVGVEAIPLLPGQEIIIR